MDKHIAALEKLHNHASDRRYLSTSELEALRAAIALMRGQSEGGLANDIARAEDILAKSRALHREIIFGRVMIKHLDTIKAFASPGWATPTKNVETS